MMKINNNFTRKCGAGCLLLLIILTQFVLIIPNGVVQAQQNQDNVDRWVNAFDIRYGGNKFTADNDEGDGTGRDPLTSSDTFTFKHDGCKDRIEVSHDAIQNPSAGKKAVLTTQKRPPGSTCQDEKSKAIELKDSQNAFAFFTVVDKGTIYQFGAKTTFKRDGNTDKFLRKDEAGKGCQDVVELNVSRKLNDWWLVGGEKPKDYSGLMRAMWFEHDEDDSSIRESPGFKGCFLVNGVDLQGGESGRPLGIYINNLENFKKDSDTGEVPDGSTTGSGEAEPSCESSNKTVLIGWLICGIVNSIDSTVYKTIEVVDEMLNIDTALYQDSGLKTVWSSVRNIASFLLIGIGLFMIISQAIGGGRG